MPDDPDELLTVAEVAERFKVNQQTVRNWIDRGELAGLRIGSRRVRVRAGDLAEFIIQSAAARRPNRHEAERAYKEAVRAADVAVDGKGKAAALRAVSRAADTLARTVSP